MDKQNELSKEEKLMAIRSIAWEMLKFSPQELKKQGINPISLVGANFGAKELLSEMGIDIDEALSSRK